MSELGIRKKDQFKEINKNNSYAVYLLVENDCERVTDYLVSNGMNILFSTDTLSEMKSEIVLDTDPFILVVVESGMGRFSNVVVRDEIVDLLGIVSVEKNQHVILFYTDKYLKSDANKIGDVNVIPYEGSGCVLDTITEIGVQLEKPKESIVRRNAIDVNKINRNNTIEYDKVDNVINTVHKTKTFIDKMRKIREENRGILRKQVINEDELGDYLDQFKVRI